MLDYASEADECRSRFLLRYFGQEESADCGQCDVCRAKAGGERLLRARIKDFVDRTGGVYPLPEIQAEMDNPAGGAAPRWLPLLRKMIDDGEIPPYSMTSPS